MDFPINLFMPQVRPDNLSARGIARTLVENMSGSIDGVIDREELQESESPAPVQDVAPDAVRVNNVLLSGSPTANRVQTLQNKNGVIALLDDVLGVRPTVILPEGLVSVDWDVSDNFMVILDGRRQSTFYMTHSKSGMEIDLLLVNNGINQTVYAWDPLIKWPAATAPSMPAALSGTSALMLVTVENIGGTMYGDYLNYSSATPLVHTGDAS